MANRYDIGDVVRLTGTWTDPIDNGAALDPDAIFCVVTSPDGEVTTYEYGGIPALTRSAAGIYYVDIDADATGRWKYRFYSTGSGKAAERKFFIIDPA